MIDATGLQISIPAPPDIDADPIWYMQQCCRTYSEADMRQMSYRIRGFQRAGGRLLVQEDVLDYVRSLSANNVAPFIRAWAALRDGAAEVGVQVAPGLPGRAPWRPARGVEPIPRWEPSAAVASALGVILTWLPPKVLSGARWLQCIPARTLQTYIPGPMAPYRLDVSKVGGVYRLYPNPTDAQIAALVTLAEAAGGRGGATILANGGLSAIEDLQIVAPRTPLVPVRPYGPIPISPARLKEIVHVDHG